jgi:Holliday junction resolvase RusA-like endonuclease
LLSFSNGGHRAAIKKTTPVSLKQEGGENKMSFETKCVYSAFVRGIPKAQPRPRMTRTGHAYNPDAAKEWKKAIQAAFLPLREETIDEKETIDEAVALEVCFFMPRPKGMKKTNEAVPHTKKPDADNLLKAVMDALTDIKIWRDDSLVFSILSHKSYADRCRAGALIAISTV